MTELLITGITSGIIFILYVLFILLIMLFISSYLAAIILLLVPVLVLIAMPEIGIEFFSFKQAEFLNGTVTINNLHFLLFIWSALLSIIIYTELLSWYISRGTLKKEGKKSEEKPVKKPGQVNIPFKPLERLLQKIERIIGGNK